MLFDDIKPSNLFQCKKCGECCKGYGGTYVTTDNIKEIAAYIHANPDEFRKKYCRISGNRALLKQSENGFCIFWDDLCTIHPVKPKMCREWPFIKSVLADIKNWEIMASSCPGIRTNFPDHIIRAVVEKKISQIE